MTGFQRSMFAFSTQQFVNNKPVFREQYQEMDNGKTGILDYKISSKNNKKTLKAKRDKKNKKWKLSKSKKQLTKKQILNKIREMRNPSKKRIQ